MSHTNSLIDQFKLKNGLESDYAAAKALGVRPNRISNYRTMTSHADDKTAIMLADALGLDRLTTIAKINQDRSTDVKEKAFWKSIASAAAMLLLALPFQGHTAQHAMAEQNAHICIMRNTV